MRDRLLPSCLAALSLGGCLTPSSGPQQIMMYENAYEEGGAKPAYELVEFDNSSLTNEVSPSSDINRFRSQS